MASSPANSASASAALSSSSAASGAAVLTCRPVSVPSLAKNSVSPSPLPVNDCATRRSAPFLAHPKFVFLTGGCLGRRGVRRRLRHPHAQRARLQRAPGAGEPLRLVGVGRARFVTGRGLAAVQVQPPRQRVSVARPRPADRRPRRSAAAAVQRGVPAPQTSRKGPARPAPARPGSGRAAGGVLSNFFFIAFRLLCGLYGGQGQAHGGAAPDLALKTQLCAVQRGDARAQRQAQPAAALLPRAGFVHAVKRFAQVGQVGGGHARSRCRTRTAPRGRSVRRPPPIPARLPGWRRGRSGQGCTAGQQAGQRRLSPSARIRAARVPARRAAARAAAAAAPHPTRPAAARAALRSGASAPSACRPTLPAARSRGRCTVRPSLRVSACVSAPRSRSA